MQFSNQPGFGWFVVCRRPELGSGSACQSPSPRHMPLTTPTTLPMKIRVGNPLLSRPVGGETGSPRCRRKSQRLELVHTISSLSHNINCVDWEGSQIGWLVRPAWLVSARPVQPVDLLSTCRPTYRDATAPDRPDHPPCVGRLACPDRRCECSRDFVLFYPRGMLGNCFVEANAVGLGRPSPGRRHELTDWFSSARPVVSRVRPLKRRGSQWPPSTKIAMQWLRKHGHRSPADVCACKK